MRIYLFQKHNHIMTQNEGQNKTFTILIIQIKYLLLINRISISIMKV